MHWSPGMWQTFLIYGARLGKQGRRISGSGQGDHGGTWKSTKNGGTGSKRPGTREHRTLAQTHSERSGNGDPPQPQKDSGSGSGAPRRKAKPAGLKAQAVFCSFRTIRFRQVAEIDLLLRKNHADRAVPLLFV